MKASDLIKELQRAINEHGDLPVRFFEDMRDNDVGSVVVYDDNGNYPDQVNGPAEIYLHGGLRGGRFK